MRNRLDRARATELLSFWARQRALSGEAAQRRLPEVVCVLRRGGKLMGASSVYAAELELIGGRRFWVYRSLLDPAAADQAPAMIRATFDALQAEFDGAERTPIGLCVLVGEPALRRARPEAEWADPRAIYAGYLPDGRQLRIAYFKDALISRGRATPVPVSPPAVDPSSLSRYRIEPFSEQTHVTARDVIELWTREGVLSAEEAERRVAEVLVVATDPDHRLAGISTSYLRRNAELLAELWYTRVFVAAAHRQHGLAIELIGVGCDHLVERYRTGADRRGIGFLFEVQSEVLRRALPQAISPRTQSVFIGEDAGGTHIRVRYFPGALAPEPPG